jgi:hypothetical protein
VDASRDEAAWGKAVCVNDADAYPHMEIKRLEAENAKLRVELERAQARIEKLEKLKASRRWNAAVAMAQAMLTRGPVEGEADPSIQGKMRHAVLLADALLAALGGEGGG